MHGRFEPPHRYLRECLLDCRHTPPNSPGSWDEYEAAVRQRVTLNRLDAARERNNALVAKLVDKMEQ